MSIVKAARSLDINYSTAKSIVRRYDSEKSILTTVRSTTVRKRPYLSIERVKEFSELGKKEIFVEKKLNCGNYLISQIDQLKQIKNQIFEEICMNDSIIEYLIKEMKEMPGQIFKL